MSGEVLRIGVAGLGTVGGGVLKIVTENREKLATRAGRAIEITAVSARDRNKDRGVDVSTMRWFDDPVALARDPDLDVVVEVIGGPDGPAKATADAALGRGAHFITANKAMMAQYGPQLAAMAEDRGAALRMEAAVAGGIPAIKALVEGLAANSLHRIYGVLNGTCNFILTEMERTGRSYSETLAEAQERGYAEADSTADVGGFDTAQKLCILASLAFGTMCDYDGVSIEGIERIEAMDIQFARDLGYRVKLIGVAKTTDNGVTQWVSPCLTPANSVIGGLESVTNAVVFDGDFIGQTAYVGPGAGTGPTASAIVADIIDIARGNHRPCFGVSASQLAPMRRVSLDALPARYYIRLSVNDQPGALARIAGCLGDDGVSIDQMRQHGRRPEPATVLIVTHEAPDGAVRATLEAISRLDVCLAEPVALRIESA